MNIKVIGCSTTWTSRPTSSYCVDDKILIDCGEGTFKFYQKAKVDYLKIKNIFITHLHADHTLALGSYICQHVKYTPPALRKSLTIYGPIGLAKALNRIKKFAIWEDDVDLEDYINIVEISNFEQSFSLDNLNITINKLKHGKVDNLAYSIYDEKSKVGFSGDCTMCDEVYDFIEKNDVCFLECCGLKTNENHLGFDEYKKLVEKYKNKKFFAIHCKDEIYKNAKKLKIKVAKHGKKYIF